MTPGTLNEGEPHPAAFDALSYVLTFSPATLSMCLEVFASTALAGNRAGEICSETLRRVLAGEPVSDRYVLGLAWKMLELQEGVVE